MSAKEIEGSWQAAKQVPESVLNSARKSGISEPDPQAKRSDSNPEIIVATEPTELIVTEGEPNYTPVESTGLLYMSNTESDVFLQISSQQQFVLLSGRWYEGKGLKGPWN